MISVCLATYNGEKFILQQLESILVQLGEDDEIIISDDKSIDSTLAIINGISDSRIKVFVNDNKDMSLAKYTAASFRFAAENFQNAIKQAKGDFIFLSDQDDIWMPDRIKKTLSLLEQNDLIMCNYKVINRDGAIINHKYFSKNPISYSLLFNVVKTPFLGCCMAFRRSVLDYVFPFPKACIGHDLWIGCMVLHLGSFEFVEEPLHLYRKHDANVSPATGNSKNSFFFKIQYRIVFIWQIILRSLKYKILR